jgi:hypothetical protein
MPHRWVYDLEMRFQPYETCFPQVGHVLTVGNTIQGCTTHVSMFPYGIDPGTTPEVVLPAT